MAEVELAPLPPAEAVEYFRAKGYRLGFAWQDVWQHEHAQAFTVAKAMRLDVLQDIRTAVDKAIADGTTFAQFQKELTPLLQAKGWWGRQAMTDPLTGERSEVQLGSPRRLRIIFDTNMRTAYAAGRWEQIQRVKERRPFLRYSAVMDDRTRPEHRRWHGTVLPVDHPWWETHYPPNGWRCRCVVQQLSARDLDRFGYRASDAAPGGDSSEWTNPRSGETIEVPEGIDPGFAYNVGEARMRSLTPPPLDRPLAVPFTGGAPAVPPPAPRAVSPDLLLPPGQPDAFYVERFLGAFGASMSAPVTFTDRIGENLVISDDLFRNRSNGRLKVTKRGRERAMLLLAEAIKDPDEIWWFWEEYPKGRFTLLRRYLARFTIEGRPAPAFALFDVSKDGWRGVTGFRADRPGYLDHQRLGTLAWRRA